MDSRELPVLLSRNAVHGWGRGITARTQADMQVPGWESLISHLLRWTLHPLSAF